VNLRQIEAFRAIILHGTMTAAADQLRTSQPSISRLIAELEPATKLKLFERRAGRITPPEEGLAFYYEVEQSFTGLEHLAQAAHDIRFFG
jgi:DNA-binding transcriptional LysR family regulator